MSLVLNDDERMVLESARGLLARSAPVSAFRALRDSGDPRRYSPELWAQLVEMGFVAPQVPEEKGGVGMGYVAAGVIAEETGRVLAATPFISTAMAAELLSGSADEEAHPLASDILTGEAIVALAVDEGDRHNPDKIQATLVADGNAWRLTGEKRFVVDGGMADHFLVVAKADDGLAIVLVPSDAKGVDIERLDLVDSRNMANVTFNDIAIPGDAVIAAPGDADRRISHALDLGRALVASELLGIAQEAFERTVNYLKEREQFGQKIGAFQALQHRASRMYVALDLARGPLLKALRAFETSDPSQSALASLAKATATKTARHVLNEAIQLHGGIGVTDEYDIGLFFKRGRVAGETFGDDFFHAERLANLAFRI